MERTKERGKVFVAVVVSLVLHLAIALSLAAFGGKFNRSPDPEEALPQLTLMEVPVEPAVAALTPRPNPQFVETDESKRAAAPPKEQTFESNANSIGASSAQPSGNNPMPAQNGKERPFPNTETHDFALNTSGSAPQKELETAERPVETPTPRPRAQPTATPLPTATPAEAPTPAPDALAMLTATPPPAFSAAPTDSAEPTATPEIEPPTPTPLDRPEPPRKATSASSYQAQKEETRITGRITNRGPTAMNAVETPLGRYRKAVSDAIGSRWYYYTAAKMDLLSVGTAHIEASITPAGQVENLRVLSNNANEAFVNVCLESFQEAQIPPIPEELIATLPAGRMPLDITFTTFSNP